MSETTLTIALNGNVPLREFSIAVQGLSELVYGLTEELAPGTRVVWDVDALETGSAIATVRGTSDDARVLERIASAYAEIGNSLKHRAPLGHSLRVARAARQIAGVINGEVTSLRFETETQEIYIASHYDESKKPSFDYAIGTIKGTVESMARRRGVRFTVYDALFDRPISCYLDTGRESEVQDFWGKTVLVSGVIGRDSDTGRPINIRKILEIRPADTSPVGSFQKAKGILRLGDDDKPEDLIRKSRNDE